MVDTLKTKLLKFFARDFISHFEKENVRLKEVEKNIHNEINRRVAEIISKMDPYEPLLKEYHGIFSEEFERVEENLSDAHKIGMAMWAYGLKDDIYMKRMIEWIMNNAGNEVLKRAPISVERTQYGRAQIANMILFRKEIGRLSSLYEEMLNKRKGGDFDSDKTIE